ncbi:MAG: DUF2608 domain-containing protein [Rickettsiaceae bacterium]|nr:DUF2608 domain-containing protein [Rickettsiaceae bacterium]
MRTSDLVLSFIHKSFYFSLLLVIFLCFTCQIEAKIVKINSITENKFTQILSQVDNDTIVLVEIDGAVTMPMAAMFSRNANPYRGFINNLRQLSKTDSFYSSVIASWYQQRSIKLTENHWPSLIKDLQNKGAKVFGIYSTPIQLINIEPKILAELTNFGIRLTPSINEKSEFIIKKQEAWFSYFYNGIIVVGPYSRANTIIEFLRLTYLPSKIIIVSNLATELEKIEAKLRVFNMKFYNVIYIGNKSSDPVPNAEIVKLQQQQLIRNQKWIEDEQAARILNIN